jgi:TonB family protein
MKISLLTCAVVLAVSTLATRAIAESQPAASSSTPVSTAPVILSVRSSDGKDVPYGKVYGDFDISPVPRFQAAAEYPPELSAKGVKGAAIVKLTLTAKGEPRDLTVQASQPEFGAAALAAAMRNRYVPAQKAKKKVECKMELLYTFPGPFVIGREKP